MSRFVYRRDLSRELSVGLALTLAGCLGAVTPPGEQAEDGSTSGSPASSSAPATSADAMTAIGPMTHGGSESESTGDGTGPATTFVEVGHAREFRGAWVASVFNINFPTGTGLSVAEQEAELVEILDTMAAMRLNAVMLQVRPESDALYVSDLEPWSRFLTGLQGTDPGHDPLAFALEEAHARGIEVHAWINPFRAKVDNTSLAVAPHPSIVLPQYAYDYGSWMWMDPAADEVRDQVVDVALDLVDRYNVDGIHLDDYYYPYRVAGEFPDNATWQAYLDGGGVLSLGNWRRDNINRLMEALHTEILAASEGVRFGAAPFGIYRSGIPPGISGLDQWNSLYSDPVHWMQQGWVDYLAPQLYWTTSQPQQAYDVLLEWWSSIPPEGHHIFAGNNVSNLGSTPDWTVDEVLLQVGLSRDEAPVSLGNIFFNVDPLVQNTSGIATALTSKYYRRPALTPPLPREDPPEVAPPEIDFDGGAVLVSHPQPTAVRWFVVYGQVDGAFLVDSVVDASATSVSLGPGTWAISAADKLGTESLGVAFDLL